MDLCLKHQIQVQDDLIEGALRIIIFRKRDKYAAKAEKGQFL